MDAGGWIALIIGMIIAIILSIIFFTITLFIVKAAADIVFGSGNLISSDFGVLTAGIITVGSMLGGAGVLRMRTV